MEHHPARVTIRPVSPQAAEATVVNGRGLFALRPDSTPVCDSTTFRWWAGDVPVYETGNCCYSCDLVMLRIGWAPADAVRVAQCVRKQVADVRALDPPLLAALRPLLSALASGQYQVRLVNLRLNKDGELVGPLPKRALRPEEQEPRGAPLNPAYLRVCETQPTEALDPATVEEFKRRITAGDRPAAIMYAYAMERRPDLDCIRWPIRCVILDGHHKLAAYAALRVPVRAILFCDRDPAQPSHLQNPLAPFYQRLGPVRSTAASG